MKDIDKACARYEQKLRRSERGRAWGLTVEEQTARYRAGLEHGRELDLRVQAVLEAAGVATIHRPLYYAFARRIDKWVRNGIAGEALRVTVAVWLNSWLARGLTQSVLERIVSQVFGLEP